MMRWRPGGCHCGKVRFEALLPDDVEIEDCNCSICSKTGYLHVIVPAAHLRQNAGREALISYRFNTGAAEHLFCGTCGVKPYYRPRSNPDGWSVNFRCFDAAHGLNAKVVPFDGRNWEANGPSLARKSKT